MLLEQAYDRPILAALTSLRELDLVMWPGCFWRRCV